MRTIVKPIKLDHSDHIRELLVKALSLQASAEELAELETWIRTGPAEQRVSWLGEELNIPDELLPADAGYDRPYWDAMADRVLSADRAPVVRVRERWFGGWRRYAAAAAILLLLAGSGYLYLGHKRGTKEMTGISARPGTAPHDIAPGGNKATLTLADGSMVVLEKTANGNLAIQGAAQVAKDKNLLSYIVGTSPATSSTIVYNTLTTPRSGEFQVVLPDGTKVWLNNASSLRYPTSFVGSSREVELTGEAYFEVANNKLMPFRVKVDDMYVTVLGTHFNIMAYQDEALVKTTLLEGLVRVSRGDQTTLLSPGQQAQAGKELRVVQGANTEEAVAWKEGLFEFNSADIETVMRSLARWYDVGIRYKGPKTSHRLTGKIRRDSNASDVLQILSVSGYHFSIEGNIITVLP